MDFDPNDKLQHSAKLHDLMVDVHAYLREVRLETYDAPSELKRLQDETAHLRDNNSSLKAQLQDMKECIGNFIRGSTHIVEERKGSNCRLSIEIEHLHDRLAAKEKEICTLQGNEQNEWREFQQSTGELKQLRAQVSKLAERNDNVTHLKQELSDYKDRLEQANAIQKQVKQLTTEVEEKAKAKTR
ncbi:hypothetical protein DM01DRAFT_1339196 [Hesseltinella vesiculosa]|uniref:Uncharacterized protein n=1 Tax=Hesseltinella vesiculosa TaxID=101127 RepID=A0A1X2G7Q6_9FUNG|nr:hypothetical protein DM01DRAFT_1339196 [Hesseltinella vesiculosa]